ncbi:hypothetical protein A2Z33_03040 [Candidatus Gottesmanbacteria bacterium RBG_16_52_11]|uniref:peptidylprolyl isomerase n=1 Tax=Candidatus Gottesmanbacteria bacterium RBG_16_52_11 TaxID=1798374 RepID=A0A1F5YVI8_9BACT|nr:MAG: hypothetical protein A2Z33_03040 [Candidatus Gottesmanbacteria bacterium RBG_16_52_11]
MPTKNTPDRKRRVSRIPKKTRLPVVRSIVDKDLSIAGQTYDSVTSLTSARKSRFSSWYIIALLVLILVGIILVRRGYIVSALVDGKPIFSWQLQKELSQRFGKQMLEGMITEKLIRNEAQKAGVGISQEDINARQQEMIANIGGQVSIDDLLKYQGLTREEFDTQTRMQLLVEKLLGREYTITDTDIDNYIATNRARLVSTTAADLREESRRMLMDQFLGKRIQPWFTEIKEKANIVVFP